MDKPKQLECRIVITNLGSTFKLAMFDPVSMRCEQLGQHPTQDQNRIVRDLKTRMEKENHLVTFSEWNGKR